ncbi:hypothetical protein FACS1894190_02630 [Spirochaetia bacterium]|nr:hypothetical protein FACS1894190_02630 [Spirochaetia bacterium]
MKKTEKNIYRERFFSLIARIEQNTPIMISRKDPEISNGNEDEIPLIRKGLPNSIRMTPNIRTIRDRIFPFLFSCIGEF